MKQWAASTVGELRSDEGLGQLAAMCVGGTLSGPGAHGTLDFYQE